MASWIPPPARCLKFNVDLCVLCVRILVGNSMGFGTKLKSKSSGNFTILDMDGSDASSQRLKKEK